jgi:predicted permease
VRLHGLTGIAATYRPAFLSVGILVDQLGTCMVLSTAGVLVGTVFSASGRAASPEELARRIATFPPFQALVLGLALMMGWTAPLPN